MVAISFVSDEEFSVVIKKNNAQNPLFVATKPYHEDIISMFFPKARSIYFDMYLKQAG